MVTVTGAACDSGVGRRVTPEVKLGQSEVGSCGDRVGHPMFPYIHYLVISVRIWKRR